MTIEAEHIEKSFDGRIVLDDFSLEISNGNAYAITGPSGSGKTTFLRILLGLEKPDKGRIRLLGDYKYAWINAGVVFQEDRLCENFSAVTNVAMVNRKLSERIAREELEKLLPADVLDKPVCELSGGQRRRVAVARACIIPSDVLVMDEPFTGMDEETRKKTIAYIKEVKATTPLVLTTHDLTDLAFCKEVDITGHGFMENPEQ